MADWPQTLRQFRTGRFKGNVWKGPPRHLIRGKFERWARNLERGAKLRGDGVRRLENITVETCVEILW